MKKELKSQIIESISAQLKAYPNFYITDIAGLNAGQTSKLRRECFEAGIVLNVVKNTLFAHVLNATDNEEMKSLTETLVGNTAIMYTEVPAAPGKLIKKLQKEGFSKPVVKGAYVQDCVFIGEDKLDQLASIKTKEELIGEVISLLQSPHWRTPPKARARTRKSVPPNRQPRKLLQPRRLPQKKQPPRLPQLLQQNSKILTI